MSAATERSALPPDLARLLAEKDAEIAALREVIRAARAEALREASWIAQERESEGGEYGLAATHIAAAIRALIESNPTEEPMDTTSAPFRIVVLPSGWVLAGRYAVAADGTFTLTDAAVIRRWGTTRGLGELHGGPRDETVLDPCGGEVRGLVASVLFTVDLDQDAWRGALS